MYLIPTAVLKPVSEWLPTIKLLLLIVGPIIIAVCALALIVTLSRLIRRHSNYGEAASIMVIAIAICLLLVLASSFLGGVKQGSLQLIEGVAGTVSLWLIALVAANAVLITGLILWRIWPGGSTK